MDIIKYIEDKVARSVFANDCCPNGPSSEGFREPAIIFPFSNLVNIFSLTYSSATVTQSQCTMEKKLNIFKCQNSMLDVGNNTEVICLRTGQSIIMKDTWKLHKILINYFTFICSIEKPKI